jgi:hypothetical protein
VAAAATSAAAISNEFRDLNLMIGNFGELVIGEFIYA